jgi:hypothetical protein
MTATLQEMLLAPNVQPQVVADCQSLVDQELASKGIAATPIKVAYKAVTAFAPGYYQEIVQFMIPQMVEQLQPFWADFSVSGGSEFGDYLAKRSDEVSEALLAITDRMAGESERAAIVKAYKAVRGSAGKNITAALPNLGAMIQKYA